MVARILFFPISVILGQKILGRFLGSPDSIYEKSVKDVFLYQIEIKTDNFLEYAYLNEGQYDIDLSCRNVTDFT